MITYKLAKQLKDAGFPQENGNQYFVPEGIQYDDGYGKQKTTKGLEEFLVTGDCQSYLEEGVLFVGDYRNDNYVEYPLTSLIRKPTLSELIEACGDGFESLTKDEDLGGWACYGTIPDFEGDTDYVTGSDHDEAVALLYLILKE